MRIDVVYSQRRLLVDDGYEIYLISLDGKPRLEYSYFLDDEYDYLQISDDKLLVFYERSIEARSLEDPDDVLWRINARKKIVPTYSLISEDGSAAALYYVNSERTVILDLEVGRVHASYRGIPVRLKGTVPVIYSPKRKAFLRFLKEVPDTLEFDGLWENEGDFVALLNEDKVGLFDVRLRELTGSVSVEGYKEILGAFPSPSGSMVLLDLFDGLEVLNLEGERLISIKDAISRSVSHDDRYIAVKTEGEVRLYRGRELLRTRRSKRFPRFTVSGYMVLEGKRSIVVYDPSRMKVVKIFRFSPEPSERCRKRP